MTGTGGRVLHAADRALAFVENGLNLVAGLVVFALMFLGVCQIVMRTFFRAPIFGYIDIVEVAMVGFAILSIAFVQRMGAHVRMELLVQRLEGRALWLVELLGTLLAMFIVGVLIPYSFAHFQRAYDFGDSTIDIQIVTWPAKLVVPVTLGALQLRLALQLAGYARLVVSPDATPVAVPERRPRQAHIDRDVDEEGARLDAGGPGSADRP